MTINNDCMMITIATAKYEKLLESQTKLQIFERLAKREKSSFVDLAAVFCILGVEREENGDPE